MSAVQGNAVTPHYLVVSMPAGAKSVIFPGKGTKTSEEIEVTVLGKTDRKGMVRRYF